MEELLETKMHFIKEYMEQQVRAPRESIEWNIKLLQTVIKMEEEMLSKYGNDGYHRLLSRHPSQIRD